MSSNGKGSRSTFDTIRRVRLGDVKRLLRDRYGYTLPDDDAGRTDLEELLCLSADTNHENVVEVWAPWLDRAEAEQIIAHVRTLPPAMRCASSEILGKRQRLTNKERERLHVWQIKPCDITAEELTEFRKAKERARKRLKRQRQPRAVYLAKSLSKRKPWEAEGIGRAQWYRRKKRSAQASANDETSVSGEETGLSATNSLLPRTHLSHAAASGLAPQARFVPRRRMAVTSTSSCSIH